MLPSKITFSKLNSAGNDFIFLDNTGGDYSELLKSSDKTSAFVRALCRRGLSVGADGVIFANRIEDGNSNTIIARFLEPDGSEARLCGNGTACFVYWAVKQRLAPGPEVEVITRAGSARGELLAEKNPSETRVCIPDPLNFNFNRSITSKGREWRLHTMEIGVPHAAIFVENIEAVDVERWGRLIRHHPEFQPEGINVNFVQVLEPGHLAVRTFEFGVESETLACGTGSAAAAIVACLEKMWGDDYHDCSKSILVHTRSGDILNVFFELDMAGRVNNVCMTTTVRPVYKAEIMAEQHRLLEKTANFALSQ